MAKRTTLIRGGHLVDPSQNIDAPHDILIENGEISDIAKKGSQTGVPVGATVIDATGLHVLPMNIARRFRRPALPLPQAASRRLS